LLAVLRARAYQYMTPVQAAIIGALITFCGSALAAVINLLRERSDRRRWERELQLEEKRIDHERNRWAIELTRERELELFRQRILAYPSLMDALEPLGEQGEKQITEVELDALAEKLNSFGYGAAGLYMLPDTRRTLFILRDRCRSRADGKTSIEEIRRVRTDLIERMRRDLNLESIWRDLDSLLEHNRRTARSHADAKGGSLRDAAP
jgi:hypothetical protein